MKKNLKIITFFGFFVLPFLIGVALLFRGFNSLRHLKKYYPVDVIESIEGVDTVYYQVPNLTFISPFGDTVDYPNDTIPYLVRVFDAKEGSVYRKHLTYLDNLMNRHSGIHVLALFSHDQPNEVLIEDEFKLLERNDRLHYGFFNESKLDSVSALFFPEGKLEEADYTLVDRNRFIRAQFDIKDARDIRKRVNILKLLDREYYKNERIRVEQLKE